MLNQASRTLSDVGRTFPVGVLMRLPLNSPAIMRSKTRYPRLNRRAPLPIVSFKPESDIERVGQPVFRYHIGPAESDRGQHARPVIQREPQMIRPHAPRADRPRVGTNHLRFTLDDGSGVLPAIGFRWADVVPEDWLTNPLDVAFRLERDDWQGRTTIQARVASLAPHNRG